MIYMTDHLAEVTAIITRHQPVGLDSLHEPCDLLLFQNPQGGSELPGGPVDDGETPEQAVLRSVTEVTGLDAYLPDGIGSPRARGPRGPWP